LIDNLYGGLESDVVSSSYWAGLASRIRGNRMLRNISTIALPPTGRSALVISASTGIEPHFLLTNANREVLQAVRRSLINRIGRCATDRIVSASYSIDNAANQLLDEETRKLLEGALDIPPLGHIAMAAVAQKYSDEAVSKTINLPAEASASDVREIYMSAYNEGMSGVTVYINGTHSRQPISLER